jgi:ribosomal protein S18 acetylase RimI-like enzyme
MEVRHYVRPDHRRKGLGEKMLRKVMESYPCLWGITGSTEWAALMQKCGVRTVMV